MPNDCNFTKARAIKECVTAMSLDSVSYVHILVVDHKYVLLKHDSEGAILVPGSMNFLKMVKYKFVVVSAIPGS